jgi:hypothetical protein
MRIVYDELTKEVIQVVNDDSSITAAPQGVVIIQGSEQTVMEAASLLGLIFPSEEVV